MNFLIRLVLGLAGLASVAFGAHGFRIYLSDAVDLSDKDPQKLFLAIDVPSGIKSWIEWMSIKGLESIFFPLLFVLIGIALWIIQGKIKSSKA